MTEAAADRNLRWARDAKRKRTGTCRVCGTVTRYAGKPGKPISDMCHRCGAAEHGARRRGTEGVTADVLEYLAEPRRFSEVRDHFGLTNGYTSSMLIGRLLNYGLIRRVSRGVYVRVNPEAEVGERFYDPDGLA